MPNKQNVQAIADWTKENTDLIRIRPRKHEHLPERVQQAVDQGYAKSRQAYMLEAIRRALESDGIPGMNEPEETGGASAEERISLPEQIRMEMEGMSAARKQEVLNFVRFLKTREE